MTQKLYTLAFVCGLQQISLDRLKSLCEKHGLQPVLRINHIDHYSAEDICDILNAEDVHHEGYRDAQ